MSAILFVSPYKKRLSTSSLVMKLRPDIAVQLAFEVDQAVMACNENRFDGIFCTPISSFNFTSTVRMIEQIRKAQGPRTMICVITHSLNMRGYLTEAGCNHVVATPKVKHYIRDFIDRLPKG